jgi:ATP-dependent DNA ligase
MRRSGTTRLETLPRRKAEFIQLDGYRAIAVKSGQAINLFSRRGKSFNSQYPSNVTKDRLGFCHDEHLRNVTSSRMSSHL